MKRKYLIGLSIILLVTIVFIVVLVFKKAGPGKYTYLKGTVTAYDVTPSYSDGGIIFKIDNQSVDIGGGLRQEQAVGEVYQSIRVGDKVQAKLISPEPGYLTVYGCAECYVKKSN